MRGAHRAAGLRARRTARVSAIVLAFAAFARCGDPTAPDPITSVSLTTPSSLLVGPGGGQTAQLSATASTGRGRARPSVTFQWSSTAPSVATVSATGVVTAVSVGSTTIRASVGNVVGTALLAIVGVPTRSLSIAQDSLALSVSLLNGAETRQLLAEQRDSTGAVLSGRPTVWTSTVPTVATVSPTGSVTAVAAGETWIIASSLEGRADTVRVRVTVDDTLPGDADIEIVAAAWTQAIQDEAGGVPLVRNGRAAVLNVVMRSTRSIATPSALVLRVFDQTGTLVRADTTQVTVPFGLTPSFASPAAQFLLSSSELQPGRRWELVRDPAGVLPDADASNDRYPAGGPRAFDLVDVPVLRVRFVPIVLTAHGSATGDVSPDNLGEYMRVVRAIMPHGEIEVTIGDPLASGRSFGTIPSGGATGFWIPLLGDLDAARVASAQHADAHWVGVVRPPPGFTFTAFGGFGYIPGSGASFGPATRTAALVSVGWFNREAQTRELVAHELGHNFGRAHAPCGNPANPDPAFPNAGGTIGEFAHDVASRALGLAPLAYGLPASTGDIMGYCSAPWISRYSYLGVLDFRGLVPASARVALRRVDTPRGRRRVLLVRGAARPGTVTLEPTVDLETAVTGTEEGDHLVEGRAADGRLLFARRFALTVLDHSPDTRAFAVTVPADAAMIGALESIVVRGPSGEARRTRRQRDAAPTAPRLRTDAGLAEVSCAAGTESIAVQDQASGRLLGIAPGPALRLTTPPRDALRVVCSDGVRSTVSIVVPR